MSNGVLEMQRTLRTMLETGNGLLDFTRLTPVISVGYGAIQVHIRP